MAWVFGTGPSSNVIATVLGWLHFMITAPGAIGKEVSVGGDEGSGAGEDPGAGDGAGVAPAGGATDPNKHRAP